MKKTTAIKFSKSTAKEIYRAWVDDKFPPIKCSTFLSPDGPAIGTIWCDTSGKQCRIVKGYDDDQFGWIQFEDGGWMAPAEFIEKAGEGDLILCGCLHPIGSFVPTLYDASTVSG